MKRDIITKLKAELDKEINSEPQVVYILVEIRKLLEQNKAKDQYAALNFHCNWVVHVQLDKSAFATKIVRFFDEIHETSPDPIQHIHDVWTEELSDVLGIDAFRRDLQTFLHEHGLPTDLCGDTAKWREFMNQYSEIIADCPLVINGTKHIERVIVTKADSDDPGVLFRLFWKPVFKTSYAGTQYCLILPFAT
jgi:hypothetical protein